MNMIRFNTKNIVNHLKYIDEIYIICYSGKRANFIKNKYFKDYDNIKVNKDLQFKNFTKGINKIKLNYETIELNVIENGYNYYSIMRIIQTIIGSLILLIGGYTLYEINGFKKINKIPLIILMLFGLMALINGHKIWHIRLSCIVPAPLIHFCTARRRQSSQSLRKLRARVRVRCVVCAKARGQSGQH